MATDVTQINIGPEKLYLSPILDMFNGEIISYNISKSPNLEQIYDMLDKAFAKFDNAEKFDSSKAFIKALDEYIDYYNNKRIKSRLKGKSPVQYRTLSI